MRTTKAKLAWVDVCKPKTEGGLGLRSALEVSMVSGLKLIWRIFSAKKSLWVDWIKIYLLRESSLWLASSSVGSWNWRKLLKLRYVASTFLRATVKNGRSTYFWLDNWTSLGSLLDVAGNNGPSEFGIPLHMTVYEFSLRRWGLRNRRAATHHLLVSALEAMDRPSDDAGSDIFEWKFGADRYKPLFSSKRTWEIIRSRGAAVTWFKGVWSSSFTPKHSFITWLAAKNRLDTCDRLCSWGLQIDTTCVLCLNSQETKSHLFFECDYARQVWHSLAHGILQTEYVYTWDILLSLTTSTTMDTKMLFLFRLLFQSSIYHIWSERNRRRHGDNLLSSGDLVKIVDKHMRHKLLALQGIDPLKYCGLLLLWFSSRV